MGGNETQGLNQLLDQQSPSYIHTHTQIRVNAKNKDCSSDQISLLEMSGSSLWTRVFELFITAGADQAAGGQIVLLGDLKPKRDSELL